METGIPTNIPQVIFSPEGPSPEAPPNGTKIQLGFDFRLNFKFVANTPKSQNQIFKYLPEGVIKGLDVDESQVVMDTLKPYDTMRTLGYITTLAVMYVPSDMVGQLSVDLHAPLSPLYQNPDGTVSTLMSMIDPSIPLLAGSPNDPSTTSGSTESGAPGTDDAAPLGGDSGNSSSMSGTTAGVVFASIGGAAAYGAAMFFVARRYKKRRQRHQRSSSLASNQHRGSSYGGGWMAGARRSTPDGRESRGSRGSSSSNGRSVRTAQISAPMMAENSLGWN
ncbi:hypothetical protein M501DRAFT_1007596 [Patellaria atrata CBS 101060]|uniref:Uncharacterized protein n=1 Tax=Patellaria atrata CBS 101060 TaxID=1346257 RepID=A0A9P4S5A0_9PEZI|nr:hypothetical protein M501DRAFT_1007596 [Patellaria atrata CBS 101060]